MIFKKMIYLTLALSIYSTSAFADNQCGKAVGNTIMGKVTLQCQNIIGSATLTQTTMEGNLGVIGDLNATKSNLNSLDISGNTNLQDTTVSGVANIVGRLDAVNSTFKADLKLNTLSATFDHSTTQNIVVNSKRKSETTFIELKNNSVVNGNITFENGNGVVQNHNSKINGEVIGGKVIE